MGYAHIANLYADQTILLQSECYALEKIHGTSAHVAYTPEGNQLHFHSGEQQSNFEAFFTDRLDHLKKTFDWLNCPFKIHGECYGGKIQRNAWRYGDKLRFTAFDVCQNGEWLTIPDAAYICSLLDVEFVHYVRIETKLGLIDAERDATSEQAIRNGVTTRDGEFIRREGVVLRPIKEKPDHRGNRICAKHKRAEERETKTIREVNPDKAALIVGARAVAEEYVTATRLEHVLQKLPDVVDMTSTRAVISAMLEDVHREGAGEFEPSNQVNAEIGKRTAQLLKQRFAAQLEETANAT